MPVDLSFKVAKDYILVTIHRKGAEKGSIDTYAGIWQKLKELCREKRCNRIMAKLEMKDRPSVETAFQIARSAEDSGWSREYRLAMVAREEYHFYLNLIKDFMILEGYEVDLFRRTRSARKWLLGV